MATNLKISQLTPASGVNTSDYTVLVDGVTAANKRATVAQIMTAAGGGTVTSVGISVANGISVSGSPITSSGSITLGLGAITPTSVAASGAVSGSNLSGSNTGDQTISLTSDVTGSGTGSFAATISAGAVTNAKLDSMTGPTVKGRSSGSGAPSDLSMATLNGMLPNMVGDTGSGGTAGLVPAPASGDAAAKKFLTAGALWTAPDLNDLTPSQAGNSGKVLSTNGSTTSWVAAGVGSVTSVSVTTANGVSGSVATSTTTPAISLTLGAITPSSVNSVVVSGSSTPTLAVTGTSSISGSNTGDQTLNSLLPSQAGASGKNLQSDGTNVSFVADAGGTVTSVAATAGTGISVSGGPITTSGTLTITNTAPDQTVALTASTGISTSGTYPNFTITNSAPDQTVAIAAGTGISVSGTYPSFTVTNSSPSSGGTVTSVAATVPSVFSISGSPIIGAGTLAMTYSGTALPVLNGGTGVTTSTGTTNVVLSGSPTITTPVIAQINDANGNETLKLASVASAVNEISIENGSTGNPVHIRATGSDASVGLHLVAKGASSYVNVTDGVDETKRLMFNASGGTTSTRTMLSSTQTVDRTLSLPDATDMLVGKATTDTLTNKTLTSPTLTLAGVGIATSASTNLNILGSTTTVSSLRIIPGTAPTSPTNGDVWSTSTGAFIRINNTTYQFGSLP